MISCWRRRKPLKSFPSSACLIITTATPLHPQRGPIFYLHHFCLSSQSALIGCNPVNCSKIKNNIDSIKVESAAISCGPIRTNLNSLFLPPFYLCCLKGTLSLPSPADAAFKRICGWKTYLCLLVLTLLSHMNLQRIQCHFASSITPSRPQQMQEAMSYLDAN